MVVEPRYPFERCELHGLLGFPECSAMNEFGLMEPIDDLGQGVVITVALAALRRFDVRWPLCLPLGVADADVLRDPVGVANEASIAFWLPGL